MCCLSSLHCCNIPARHVSDRPAWWAAHASKPKWIGPAAHLGKVLKQAVSVSCRKAHGWLDLDHIALWPIHRQQDAALGHAILDLQVTLRLGNKVIGLWS